MLAPSLCRELSRLWKLAGRGSLLTVGLVVPANGFLRLDTGAFAMFALSEPGGRRPQQHTKNDRQKQENEKWRGEGQNAVFRSEGVERQRHGLTIGDTQDDEDDRQRKQDDEVDDFFDIRKYSIAARKAGSVSVARRQERSIVLFVTHSGVQAFTQFLTRLEEGHPFSSTKTDSPVRGFRPERDGRFFTENAPKPRSSTRFPAARASVISSSTALTMFSTSR